MCGITGIIHLNGDPVSPTLLQQMTDAISHRGPDSEGQWIEGNVGLGHRRLSIIDLSPAGHQPMISLEHRFVLSYNGEVYNFKELRAELEAAGYWFRSRTDSEVVLTALSHWGVKALDRFNGMFALALWDRKERTLLKEIQLGDVSPTRDFNYVLDTCQGFIDLARPVLYKKSGTCGWRLHSTGINKPQSRSGIYR